MINRLILVTACLILAFMPSAEWQTHNAFISGHEIIRNVDWITKASRDVKPVYTSVKKYSDEVIANMPAARIKIQQHHTATQLWYNWEMLLNRSEFQQIPIIGRLLAERLRKHPDPEVYHSIADLLAQPNMPLENKAILLDLLAEIATPDSLNQLINLAEQGVNSSLYILVLQAISRIGDNRWDGEFHEELSPALEAAWTNPVNNDQAFLSAVGNAIAAVGAPEGVEQLLQSVSGSNSGNETEETNRIKQEVAFDVIPQVRNPDAVEVLSTRVKQEPLATPAFEVSLNAIAEINSPEATQTIVDWAKDAPSEGARNLNDVLPKIDDDKSLKLISAATRNQAFQSSEIKAAIETYVENIDSNTTLLPTTAGEESSTVLPSPLIGETDRKN